MQGRTWLLNLMLLAIILASSVYYTYDDRPLKLFEDFANQI